MTIRTKVWLLVAVSVLLTAGATFWLRVYTMRRELIRQAVDDGDDIADDIKHALEKSDKDTDDRDLAITLSNYVKQHPRIQRLQLNVEREADTPSAVRIVAPRDEATEITRLGSVPREPIVYSRKATNGDLHLVQRALDLKGPWRGTLRMNWSLGPVESVVRVTERWSLILGLVQLVMLMGLSGFLIDRVVLRRLDTLARAMRDVEGGNMDRRVVGGASDEVGRLSQGFNRMLDELSNANREIRAFNERLGHEIEIATQDLSRKNAALEQLNRLLNELRRENASKVRLAALGQLAAQLAHEIGTPLSSVSGHLQLALLQRDLAPALRERLDVSTREIARIGRIVRDYLDSTRSLEPDRKPTSLGQVLKEAIEVSRGVDPNGRRLVALDVGVDPAGFVTDPGLLRQIVINLLSNALDAVERGGQVTLSARMEDSNVLIKVSDTGPGIADEDLRRIFEPFYTTKGRGKGTGLGLAICRELAKALGGAISVQSEPGKGSTFTIQLPLGPATASDLPTARSAAGGAA